MSRLRIAVIGAGNWGRNHVRTISSLPEAELVAVCDLSRDRRAKLQAQYPGAFLSEDLDAVLERAEAVIVATPAISHASVTRAAIDRGLPVLVEKPFALSVSEAEGIADLSRQKSVPLLVGHLLVFHPALEVLKRMIVDGDLGEVFYLYSQRVNLGQVRPDENALWSFGPHDVSVALYLLGETVVRVSAHGQSYLQPGIEDVVFLGMELESGVMAHAQMSWLDPHKERRLTVVGSKQMVVFDDMQPREKLKIYDKGIDRPPEYSSYGESLAIREGDIHIPRIPTVEPLHAELRHFIDVARGKAEPRAPAESGVAVTRVLAAATESLKRQGAVMDLKLAGV